MRSLKPGNKGKAVCFNCKQLRETTYQIRDVPFSDGYGEVKNILSGVCDYCNNVISIPQESTPQIKKALDQRRQVIGSGASIEELHQKVLEIMEGQNQIEIARKTGVHPTQISRIKKGFQSRDTQAILKIIERLGNVQIEGPRYEVHFSPLGL